MEIRKVPASSLKPHPENPRVTLTPKDPEYQQIKASLKAYGMIQPLIWNKKTGFLIAGHQRLSVLVADGAKEIDVVVVDLDPIQEKGLMIALNKISGRWNYEQLGVVLNDLAKVQDFNLESIGFSMPEISKILDYQLNLRDDNFDFEREADLITKPVTQKSDLILLCNHRILCGDSSNENDLKILMGDERADLLNTDYPYNVCYMQKNNHPSTSTRPKKSRKWPQIYNDNMPQTEYEAWMRQILSNAKTHLKPGAAFYIWQGLRQIPPLCQSLIDLNFHVSCLICWLKESAAITFSDYSYRSEHALYGWLEGASHYWAGKPGESNVWEVHRDPVRLYEHPTQKPIELAQRAIKNSTKSNDIVLDTFLGSGSTLIGAESLGRRCYGCEIDPRYCDVIVRRYISYVGAQNISKEIREKYIKEASHE